MKYIDQITEIFVQLDDFNEEFSIMMHKFPLLPKKSNAKGNLFYHPVKL